MSFSEMQQKLITVKIDPTIAYTKCFFLVVRTAVTESINFSSGLTTMGFSIFNNPKCNKAFGLQCFSFFTH